MQFRLPLLLSLFASGMFCSSDQAIGAGSAPQPNICTRACWGASAASGISQMSGLTRAIIHHTAGNEFNTTGFEASKANVRGIQNLHKSKGWGDIGYHFLVDKFGNTFEGRSGSMNSLPRGAHDGTNTNSFGFNLMGYFHPTVNNVPTAAMMNAMYDVIAWRMPSAWRPYGSPGVYGPLGISVGYLDAHRRVNSTACPGDHVFNPYMGSNVNAGVMRDQVNARINGSGGTVHQWIGVLHTDGLLNMKEGLWGGWVAQLGGVSAFDNYRERIGVLSGGNLLVKEGLWGAWTNQWGGGLASFKLNGNRIAVLTTDGTLSCKDGIYGSWFSQIGGVSDYQIEGNRIGAVIGASGAFYIKEGLQGGWLTMSGGGVGKIQLEGDRIGALYNNGTLSCKDGLYGSWFDQLAGVTAFQLEGNRIAVLAGGTLWVKEGLQGGWTNQLGGVSKFELAGDRIGVVTTDGTLFCKDGIYGSWFSQIAGVTEFHLSGNMIGAASGGTLFVKEGLQGGWTSQIGSVGSFKLNSWQ